MDRRLFGDRGGAVNDREGHTKRTARFSSLFAPRNAADLKRRLYLRMLLVAFAIIFLIWCLTAAGAYNSPGSAQEQMPAMVDEKISETFKPDSTVSASERLDDSSKSLLDGVRLSGLASSNESTNLTLDASTTEAESGALEQEERNLNELASKEGTAVNGTESLDDEDGRTTNGTAIMTGKNLGRPQDAGGDKEGDGESASDASTETAEEGGAGFRNSSQTGARSLATNEGQLRALEAKSNISDAEDGMAAREEEGFAGHDEEADDGEHTGPEQGGKQVGVPKGRNESDSDPEDSKVHETDRASVDREEGTESRAEEAAHGAVEVREEDLDDGDDGAKEAATSAQGVQVAGGEGEADGTADLGKEDGEESETDAGAAASTTRSVRGDATEVGEDDGEADAEDRGRLAGATDRDAASAGRLDGSAAEGEDGGEDNQEAGVADEEGPGDGDASASAKPRKSVAGNAQDTSVADGMDDPEKEAVEEAAQGKATGADASVTQGVQSGGKLLEDIGGSDRSAQSQSKAVGAGGGFNRAADAALGKDSAGAFQAVHTPKQIQGAISIPSGMNCTGRWIYMYPLPAAFNKALLERCNTMLPWYDMCPYFMNDGLGQSVKATGTLVPSGRWFETHQYALEVMFHNKVKRSYPCLAKDPELASLFYIPFYAALDAVRWHFAQDATIKDRDQLARYLVRWLSKHPQFSRHQGADHVLVAGRPTWDFRRKPSSDWGNILLELAPLKQVTKLVLERDVWDRNDIAIPHPTHFHPKSDKDLLSWQKHVKGNKRDILVSFAAFPESQGWVKDALTGQCKGQPSACRYMQCMEDVCSRPAAVMGLFVSSHFCLMPPGESVVRRGVFEALVAGCIPVLFDDFSTSLQFPWHLPADNSSYSVSASLEKLKSGELDVVAMLKAVPLKQIRKMKKYIIFDLLPKLIYTHPRAKLTTFKDAFDIAIDRMLEKVKMLVGPETEVDSLAATTRRRLQRRSN